MHLQGKIALITGGSDGYGRGIAKILKASGCKVWITGRNQEKLQRTVTELDVHGIVADVSSSDDWDKVFAQLDSRLDILVNNAGSGGKIVPVAEQSDADIVQTIMTNLTGAIFGCSRAAKIMIAQQSGNIINISSVCAMYAWPSWSVYTAAKAGLAKFSHGLYTELRPYGVRVTCVTPSWGQTNFNHAANVTGATEDPERLMLCTAPEELGALIKHVLETPDHLAVPDVTLMPMIQDIQPM